MNEIIFLNTLQHVLSFIFLPVAFKEL